MQCYSMYTAAKSIHT